MTSEREKAIRWLTSQLGSTRWYSRCEALAATAYRERPYETALAHWLALYRRGLTQTVAPIQRGDLLFWRYPHGTGHVAVATTRTRYITDTTPNRQLTELEFGGDHHPGYLGHTPPRW